MPDTTPITGIPASQGTNLSRTTGVSDALAQKLIALGITHAGQLIGTTAVDGIMKHLAKYLKVSQDELGKTIKQVKGEQSSGIASMYEGTAFSLPALGATAPTAPMMKEVAEMPAPARGVAAVALPSFVNMASDFPPIRNQAYRGTCTAFAMTALHEFTQIKTGNPQDFSEEYLYYQQKQLDQQPTVEGSWLRYSAQVLTGTGQCREAIWPYNPGNSPADTNVFGPVPPTADDDASHFLLQTVKLNPNYVPGIKAALAGGSPVPVSFPVYNSWFLAADTIRTGRLNMPIDGEAVVGGHAVCLVGYQDDQKIPGGGYFLLRNSWKKVGLELGGTVTSVDWAELSQYGVGYGTMPYDYITKLGWEAYALQTPPAAPPIRPAQVRQATGDLGDILTEGLPGGDRHQRIVIETKDGTRIIVC